MNRTQDGMPSERINKFRVRQRVIHVQGVTMKVRFEPVSKPTHGYTGILEEGADHGVIRFSLVGKVEKPVEGVTPGFGLKFFADGVPSPSLVAMYTLEGHGDDYNFFRNDFYTKVPRTEVDALKALDEQFKKAKDNRTGKKIKIARMVSAEPLTEVNSQGKTISPRKTPRILKFVPNADLKNLWDKKFTNNDVRYFLKNPDYIADGTLLYTVYGCEEDADPRESCEDYVLLGKLIAKSRGFASRFGDKSIFFNHRAYDAERFDNY